MQSKLIELNSLPLDYTTMNTLYCSPSMYNTLLCDDMDLCEGMPLITNSQRTKLCCLWSFLATGTANSFYMLQCMLHNRQLLWRSALSQRQRGGVLRSMHTAIGWHLPSVGGLDIQSHPRFYSTKRQLARLLFLPVLPTVLKNNNLLLSVFPHFMNIILACPMLFSAALWAHAAQPAAQGALLSHSQGRELVPHQCLSCPVPPLLSTHMQSWQYKALGRLCLVTWLSACGKLQQKQQDWKLPTLPGRHVFHII